MAGFMAGFGSGFADSFNQSNERLAKQQDDMFKMQYERYITKADKREAEDKANAKNIKMAKQLVQMNGQPTEAWNSVYDLLSGGASFDDVNKMLQSNQAVVSAKSPSGSGGGANAPADPRDNLTTSAANSVDAQMSASGMQKPQDGGLFKTASGTPTDGSGNAERQGGLLGGFRDALKNIGSSGSSQERHMRRANEKIANMENTTPQEIERTISGASGEPVAGDSSQKITWQPKYGGISRPDFSKLNNVGDAIAAQVWAKQYGSDQDKVMADNYVQAFNDQKVREAKNAAEANGTLYQPSRGYIADPNTGAATGKFVHRQQDGNGNVTWRDDKNNPVDPNLVRSYDKNQEAAIDKVGGQILKDSQDYNAGVTNLSEMTRTATDLDAIAQAHPEAIGLSGAAAEWASKYYRGAKGVAQIVTGQDLFNALEQGATPEQQAKIAQDNITKLDAVEKEATGILQRTNDVSYWAVLADVKATKLAYMYAAVNGQKGRNVNQKEFENFKKAAIGNGNAGSIKDSAATYIQEQYKVLKDKEQLINQNSMGVREFESQYGKGTFPYKPVGNIDELLKSNPENQRAVQAYLDKVQGNPDAKKQPSAPPMTEKAKNAGVIEDDWQYMTDEQRALFK